MFPPDDGPAAAAVASPAFFGNLVRIVFVGLVLTAFLASGCGDDDPFYRRNASLLDSLHAHDTLSEPARKYVLHGGGGHLFYLEDLRAAVSRWKGIGTETDRMASLARDLARQGRRLLVVPVPTKVETYPELLGRPDTSEVSLAKNAFLEELGRSGVDCLDLRPDFREAKSARRLFPRTDTHWDQSAIEIASEALARRLAGRGVAGSGVEPGAGAAGHLRDTVIMGFRGDLAEKFAGALTDAAPDTVLLRRVVDSSGRIYREPDSARILLFGDSFLNQFKAFGAGLGAHLAHRLGEPVRTVYSLGSLPHGPDKIRAVVSEAPGIRTVVWVFTSRSLMETDP